MLGIAGLIPDQWPLVKQTIIYSSPTASVIIARCGRGVANC